MTKISSLWLIVGVAVLPLFFAMLSYFGGWWQPVGKVNNGALIISHDTGLLPLTPGEQLSPSGQWQLVMLSPECQTECQGWMQRLEKIKTALGKDADRIEPRLANLVAGSAESIVLLDPLGNLVLSYHLEQSPRDILDDLKRLLKVSKVG
ncbi:hypothetical protein [Aliamphritea ceti]|uniref:hypothetical protein n=1 Tax=Aliamphritea ceti TaxID=1524258 RepID=UPI0021C3EFC7|nr:hypothetical protein [Aliamphritea ceti]